MNCKQWIGMFGKPITDQKVREALAALGVHETPKRKRDSTDVRFDLGNTGAIAVFTDEAFFYQREDMQLGETPPILTGIILMLQHAKANLYKGPLPHDLERNQSQAMLHTRFGPPIKSNEQLLWEQWEVEDKVLTVYFAKDRASLARVMVALKEAA